MLRRSLAKALGGTPQLFTHSQGASASACASLPHLPFSRDEQQQPHSPSAHQQQLRSLHVPSSTSTVAHRWQPLMHPSRRSSLPGLGAGQLHQARGMAGPPMEGGPFTNENTWAQFRTGYGVEKKNDLAAGMYALILVFSLSAIMHDFYVYPPRIMAMTGFIFYVLYRRKGNA